MRLFFATAVLVLATAEGLLAQIPQSDDSKTISASGSATIERRPDFMRVRVDVLAKATKLEEALAQLKDRQEAVRAQLSVLGADSNSIKFEPPRITSGAGSQQQRMQQMVMKKMRKSGSAPEEEIKSVTVASQLTADWPLPSEKPEEKLILSHSLQEKIKEADLGGKKALEALSEKEREMMEEMEGMEGYSTEYGGNPAQQKPGEPSFLFVGRISDSERAEALKSAFAKAKKQAEELAAAAGLPLGELAKIDAQMGSSFQDPSTYQRMARRYSPYGSPFTAMSGMEQGDRGEVLGSEPNDLEYRVVVITRFHIK